MTNWIVNKNGSIYHLNLHLDDLATTIITVGDPERVSMVSSRFDKIETVRQSREFKTVTGYIGNKRLSVISTGIGTDNIDIVMNEIDYLFNINADGTPKSNPISLDIIRLGTSGAIQKEISVDQLMVTNWSINFGGLLSYYKAGAQFKINVNHLKNFNLELPIYQVQSDQHLLDAFRGHEYLLGNTLTCDGFYGPQGRSTRIESSNLLEEWSQIDIPGIGYITNLEMETTGIYGLGKLLGHRTLSINAILANRITKKFSSDPEKTISRMITISLERLLGL